MSTAALLKKQGFLVEGAVLAMHEGSPVEDAQIAADQLEIPLHIIHCEKEFSSLVIQNFVQCYAEGKTPNPCVLCNRYVKMDFLYRYAKEHQFSLYATGHYAGVTYEDGRYAIVRGKDPSREQSYFLWSLTQEQLSMLYLPLAELKKEDLRQEAERNQFFAAQKKESREICFIDDRLGYVDFVEKRTGPFPEGNFLSTDGKILGKHRGIIRYTIGQRRGLGISLGEHMYVTNIDAKNNTVTLSPAGGEYRKQATVGSLVFQKQPPSSFSGRYQVKIRYGAPLADCEVTVDNGKAEVHFDTPARSVTPGQSAVFYRDNVLMFGGFIE